MLILPSIVDWSRSYWVSAKRLWTEEIVNHIPSLMLAQLLKLNGASKVVIAANKGVKMDIAKDMGVADVYIELDRSHPDPFDRSFADLPLIGQAPSPSGNKSSKIIHTVSTLW